MVDPQDMRRRAGFSLIELIIVVAIIGLIAAIAIPRFGSAVEGTADTNVAANLHVLRQAIDTYHVEHDGLYPTLTQFEAQLTGYTDSDGNVAAGRSPAAPLGPYVAHIPTFQTGRSRAKLGATASGGVDWVYDENNGQIYANGGGTKDKNGQPYSDY